MCVEDGTKSMCRGHVTKVYVRLIYVVLRPTKSVASRSLQRMLHGWPRKKLRKCTDAHVEAQTADMCYFIPKRHRHHLPPCETRVHRGENSLSSFQIAFAGEHTMRGTTEDKKEAQKSIYRDEVCKLRITVLGH
ncbi:hypothetical protein DMENIID0001_136670 [Sergentomyia squamirostris]